MVIDDNGTSFTIDGVEIEKLHESHKVVNGIIVIPFMGEGRVPMWKASETYGTGKVVWTYDQWIREDDDGDRDNPPHRIRNVRLVFA